MGTHKMAKLDKAKWQEFCHISHGHTNDMTTQALTKTFKSNGIYTKKLTTTDTDIGFSKVATKGAKVIQYEQFHDLIHSFEAAKKCSYDDVIAKLNGGGLDLGNVTKQSKTGAVDHMTDQSLYGGMHAARFDKERAEREAANAMKASKGYVNGYKEEGTFDKR